MRDLLGKPDVHCGLFARCPRGGPVRLSSDARAKKGHPMAMHDSAGDLATVERVRSRDQLRHALKRERAVSTLKLGTRLLELRLISQDQLNGALQLQRTDTRHLGEILFDLGLVSKEHLYQVLCEKLGIPMIELGTFDM